MPPCEENPRSRFLSYHDRQQPAQQKQIPATMKPSLAERGSAPLRRKSCEACKTAKRRCDLAFPACSRCASRNMPCMYPGKQPTIPQELIAEAFACIDSTEEPLFDEPLFLLSNAGALCMTDFKLPHLPDPPVSSDVAFLQDVFDPQWDYIDSIPQCLLSEPPGGDIILRASHSMTAPRTRPPMPLSVIIASRLQFAIDVLKDVPKIMVLENQTPWCHKHLYRDNMPRFMKEAYSSCALHITKTPLNTPIIDSLLKTNIQTLLTSPIPTNPQETLAHTHALLLYQIILLITNEPTTTFSLIPHLESSAMTLLSCIYFPSPTSKPTTILPPNPEATHDFWTSWIFQESARRTVLFAFFITQLYRLIHGEHDLTCDGKLGLVHSFYLSAHLWEARDVAEFAAAWAEKDHFVVGELNFGRVLVDARPCDVDVFGRMLLVSYMGIEEARAWFLARGSAL